jgi:hypothetical protein
MGDVIELVRRWRGDAREVVGGRVGVREGRCKGDAGGKCEGVGERGGGRLLIPSTCDTVLTDEAQAILAFSYRSAIHTHDVIIRKIMNTCSGVHCNI